MSLYVWHVKDNMFDINQIYILNSLLSDKEIENLYTITDKHFKWELNNTSYDDSKFFWVKQLWGGGELDTSEIIENTFREKIQNLFNIELETVELFMNGQTHGQCGKMHSDEKGGWDSSSDYITLVYYFNKEWNPELGGFTVIKDNDGRLHTVYPTPNSAVMFNSRLEHIGLEPTCHCNTMRITLAHKMKIKR